MPKKRKRVLHKATRKKEKNILIKSLLILGFITILGVALLYQNTEKNSYTTGKIAASNASPKKTLQLGWFTFFKKKPTPKPTKALSPTATPSPCPGGPHTTNQKIAFMPIVTEPPVTVFQPPPANTPTATPYLSPTPTTDPCI